MPRLHHRRMSVETDKVTISGGGQRLTQRRMSVETESPSLSSYLGRRRWSSDSIHHFTETLHLTLNSWKRRATLPHLNTGEKGGGGGSPHPHQDHGHHHTHHSKFLHFTRSVSTTLRKRKAPVPALAIVMLEDGIVELVRITYLLYREWCKLHVDVHIKCFTRGQQGWKTH